MSENEMQGTRVTLGTGKTVLLREMKIKHQELAATAAAPRAGDNPMLLAVFMQKELVKILIYAVDDKPVKASDLERLDDLFTIKEYKQVLQAVQQMMGDDGDMGKLQVEHVVSGVK
jgi:hypothetical protein